MTLSSFCAFIPLYVDPWRATVASAVASATLNRPDRYIKDVRKWRTPNVDQLWMGESALASCGGQLGVSNVYASSIWYSDWLGRCAAAGSKCCEQLYLYNTISDVLQVTRL